MKNYKLTFTYDYSNKEKEIINKFIDKKLEQLFKLHNEENVELEFLSFNVENKYLRFSAACDEPKKMWFKLNRFNDFEETIYNYLGDTLTHEFHHMIRKNYREKFNLAESLVHEGLAILFTMKLNKSPQPLYIREVSSELLEELKPLIKKDLYNQNYSYRRWQRGDKELGIPASFMYSFGYKLVKEFYENNPEMDIIDSFGIDCYLIIPDYLK